MKNVPEGLSDISPGLLPGVLVRLVSPGRGSGVPDQFGLTVGSKVLLLTSREVIHRRA